MQPYLDESPQRINEKNFRDEVVIVARSRRMLKECLANSNLLRSRIEIDRLLTVHYI